MQHHARTDKLLLFARPELIDPALADGGRPAVLLEGSWPGGTWSGARWSLDDEIDARFDWIDQEASRLAERLAEPWSLADHDGADCPAINPAWLNALGLRYYLVKLIRLLAYFTEVRPLGAVERALLVAAASRDEDYAHCLAELCRPAGVSCQVQWVERRERPTYAFHPKGPLINNLGTVPIFARPRGAWCPKWDCPLPESGSHSSAAPNGCLRRALARLASLLEPGRDVSGSRPRVVLCGNPRWLDPVCRALLQRGCRVWWLYDRFAIRSWLRWSTCGVEQLVCDSSEARGSGLSHDVPERLECCGVNLAGPVRRWLDERLRAQGPRQTRILHEIDAHFRRVRPDAVVLDEDATPMARAAVAMARRHGAASLVVQHGAPICPFGFVPLAADRILVWGRSSQQQLARWGVPPERIHVVGSPWHETLQDGSRFGLCGRMGSSAASPQRPAPRILLLTTVPPRDDRPDAVTLHLTRRTYAEMLRTAVRVVAGIPGAALVVKLHPRAVDDPIARAVLREYPALPSRVVRRGPVAKWLRRADCVLSCVSSAGIDATLARVPVIQLLPSGSGDVLPYQHWGMLGTARSDAELQRLLLRALDTGAPADAAPHPNVFHDLRGGRRITPRFRKGTVPFWAPRSAWSRENRDSPQIISGVFHDLGASAAARIADTILAARHSEQRNEERAGRALPTAFSPHAAIMVHKAAAPATRGSAGRWEAELTER